MSKEVKDAAQKQAEQAFDGFMLWSKRVALCSTILLLLVIFACNSGRKYFRWFAVSTCPPGQVLASPDMSDFRLLVEFCTFRVPNLFFDEISR